MLRRERIVAMSTLFLLNVFIVVAGASVAKLTPKRDLAPQPPSVAVRSIVAAGTPALAAEGATAPIPNANILAGRLGGLLASPGLGTHPGGVVVDTATRAVLFRNRADEAAVPASTTKVVTSTAVLAAVGPDHRLTTKVVRGADGVVLVGGGDPTLTSSSRTESTYPKPASLADLAKQTAVALKSAGTTQMRVDYDVSMYEGLRTGPGWKPGYVPDGNVAPVAALAVDEGRVAPGATARVGDPPAVAARAFTALLQRYGVSAQLGGQRVADKAAQQIAAVQSPPVSALVEHLLTHSDNDVAEAMARQVAISRRQPPTFAGGAQAIHDVLTELGVADGVQTYDGSGLSPLNRITPTGLARIVTLAAAGKRPELRSVITGMPVAGFSGTLAGRYGGGSALSGAGMVRAKTGTLAGVSTLAGVAYDADGRLLAFAFMANDVSSTPAAAAGLDQLAAAAASCGCR